MAYCDRVINPWCNFKLITDISVHRIIMSVMNETWPFIQKSLLITIKQFFHTNHIAPSKLTNGIITTEDYFVNKS